MSRTHRVIQGLLWARRAERPRGLPRSRPRGTKALGLGYERALARALGPKAVHGQWFEFADANGHGYCQPDLLVEMAGITFIIEAKLSLRLEAELQISQLYRPVVEAALGHNTRGIMVTKYLKPEADLDLVVDSLFKAQLMAMGGRMPIWHWIGKGPI